MRRFPEEPTPRRGRCVAPSREPNGEQKAPRTKKKKKKPPLAALQEVYRAKQKPKSLSQPKQKASEGLNPNASQAGPDGLLNDSLCRSKKLTTPMGLRTNKERISCLSFSAPSPAPGVTHALMIHPRSTTGGRELLTSRQGSSSSLQKRGRDVSIVRSLTIKSIRSASNRF